MDIKTFADRFKSARILRGLSLQDLSDKLDHRLTKQALHKYERGEAVPDADKIKMLAEALNVLPEFFSRPVKVELDSPRFRKLKNLSVKEEDRVVEYARDYLSRYLELEDLIGIRKDFDHPLAGFGQINKFEDIDRAAEQVRASWNLGWDPIYNLVELLEDKNIKVVEIPVEDGFDGMQTMINNIVPVIAFNSNKVKKSDRIRFTVMHELGHLLLDIQHLPEKQQEQLCNQFAGAMLFPKDAVMMELGEFRQRLFIQELGHLKQQYGISIQASIMRLKDLGVITTQFYKQFFFHLNQMNWRVDEPFDYDGVEKSNRFDQLLYRALAENIIDIEKAASLKNESVSDFKEKNFLFG